MQLNLSIPGRYKYQTYLFTQTQEASGRIAMYKQMVTPFVYFLYANINIIQITESLSHGVSIASSMQNVKYLQYFLQLSNPVLYLHNPG